MSSRKIIGCSALLLAVLIWIPGGDVIDMIIRQKEIIFGRYSRGHFAGLFFLSLMLCGVTALCFSKIRTLTEMLVVSLMVLLSVGVSGFLLVIGSSWATKARYIEESIMQEGEGGPVEGLVRHRPPNEFYRLVQEDLPPQRRSYPDAPPGYPAFELTLTTDAQGFRNQTVLDHYPVLAVGDSFVAGSHVSDEQAWVSLLSNLLNTPVYNLGASGSDPGTYYNNFYLLGRQYKPEVVIFMIYEGNDFKGVTPLVASTNPESKDRHKHKQADWGKQIDRLVAASPVTKGLTRFSSEVLEVAGSTCPVSGFREHVGWMPVRLSYEGHDTVYAFEPKRLLYLWQDKEKLRKSRSWLDVRMVMERMVALGQQEGFRVLFVYAPSTPHVVMPLAIDNVPAGQLRNFMAYEEDILPEADELKRDVFASLDNEESAFLETCEDMKWHCLGLTTALQKATKEGLQVYYSYDQHWTPDGNRVVAREIEVFYRRHSNR